MSIRLYLFLLVCIFSCLVVHAQDVRITKMEFIDSKLNIHYEIDDSNPNNEYQVSIYSSANNFSAPLTKVSGAVGEEIKAGSNKVVWSVMDELGEYKGPLSVEIRAKVFIPFVRLRNFTDKNTYKRGSQAEIEWRPGNTNPIHIELYNGNTRMQGELNHPNNGKYTISFSKDLKPGSNYKIKLTDSKSADSFIYTSEFKIKPKIPLVVKVLPILAVGYLATGLFVKEPSNELPGAPALPK